MKKKNSTVNLTAFKITAFLLVFFLAALPLASGQGTGIISDSYKIKVTFLNQEPDPVEPGRYVKVRWSIENYGSSDAENMYVKLVEKYPFSLDSGDVQKNIGTLRGRQVGDNQVVVEYQLRVDEKAIEGQNEIVLEYKVGSSGWIKLEPFEVSVQTHDSIVSIEEISSNPQEMSSGGKTRVTIKLKNLADSMIKDIKTNLLLVRSASTATSITYEELPFSPIGSTNEKILYSLDSKKSAEIIFDLVASPDAKSGIYKIPFTLSYSDSLGTNYSKSNLMTLIIGNKPELGITIDESEIINEGQKGLVTIKFVNKGLSQIKFLSVQLKDSDKYKILSPESVYLGNIDSDDYETADFMLYVNKGAGNKLKLPLKIQYNDWKNNVYDQDIELNLNLYSNEDIELLGLKKKSNTTGIFIVIVIVVIGIVVYRIIRKKRKHE